MAHSAILGTPNTHTHIYTPDTHIHNVIRELDIVTYCYYTYIHTRHTRTYIHTPHTSTTSSRITGGSYTTYTHYRYNLIQDNGGLGCAGAENAAFKSHGYNGTLYIV